MRASKARDRLTGASKLGLPPRAGKAVDASATSRARSASNTVSKRRPATASIAASSTLYATCSSERPRPTSTTPPRLRATSCARRATRLSCPVACSATATNANAPSATYSSVRASQTATSPPCEQGRSWGVGRRAFTTPRGGPSIARAVRASGRRLWSSCRSASQSCAKSPGSAVRTRSIRGRADACTPPSRSASARGPTSNSQSTTPSEYMSAAGVGRSPRACSGAMYGGVPAPWRSSVHDSSSAPLATSPKSTSLSAPSARSTKLLGLMSRWRMPRECRKATAGSICAARPRVRFVLSESVPRTGARAAHRQRAGGQGPSTNSIVKNGPSSSVHNS